MAFLCRPGPVRTAPMELGNLHAIGIIGSWGDRDGVAAFKGKVGMVAIMDSRDKAAF